jgi:hypothetical protein
LRDPQNRPLDREPVGAQAPVICVQRPDRTMFLEGSIGMSRDAASVALLRRDDVIATLPIGPKPRLSIEWAPPRVAKRDRAYQLVLTISPPTADASIRIFHSWAPRKYVLAGVVHPRKSVEMRFTDLPGGDACRLVVAYSTGLRTTAQTTKAFAVPPMPPEVEILRPVSKRVYAPWHPVELEGRIRDVQAGRIPNGDYIWTLNGTPARTGPLVFAGFLKEGRYEAVLTYKRNGAAARVTFVVRRPPRS